MKKLMMTLAVTMAALTMNAQGKYVGGSMGLTTQSYDGSTQTSISFNPHFGISFNKNMGVGLELGYSHNIDKTHKDEPDGYQNTLNTFSVSPYLRFTPLHLDKVAIFADAMLSYSTSNTKREFNNAGSVNTDFTTNTYGFFVKPGIAYGINKHFGLTARLGNLFSVSSSKPDTEGSKATTTIQFLNVSNAISFGLFYKF